MVSLTFASGTRLPAGFDSSMASVRLRERDLTADRFLLFGHIHDAAAALAHRGVAGIMGHVAGPLLPARPGCDDWAALTAGPTSLCRNGRATRIAPTSRSSAGSRGARRKPRPTSADSRPSLARRERASRTGVRLTPSSPAMAVSSSFEPGATEPR